MERAGVCWVRFIFRTTFLLELKRPRLYLSSYNNDHMPGRRKIVIISLGVLVLAVILLSASLTGLKLQEGQILILNNRLPVANNMDNLPGGLFILQFIRFVYLLALIMTPFMIIYLIISPKGRKAFLRYLQVVISISLIIFFISKFISSLRAENSKESGGLTAGLPQTGTGLTANLPPVPTPSEGLILGLSIALAVIVTLVMLGLGYLMWRRIPRPENGMVRIAFEAQNTLDDLRAGGNLKNAIMRCYYEMSRVINEQRGLQRDRTMTPREFEVYLESNGLPEAPVRQLTHLFEDVRYGDIEVGEKEEQLAQNSLTAIIEAVKGAS